MKKLISIVCPVYNEEENVKAFLERMQKVTADLSDRYKFEFIFTDNASTDRTFELLLEMAKTENRISIYRFSKNFGFQNSIYTGYCKSKGDAVIEFDCDLQDPPELLPAFLEEWEKGNKIVYGIRKKRQEGKIITLLRLIFYRFLNRISPHELPNDAGDFMMIDRSVIRILRTVYDQNLYLRGLIFSFGFSKIGIPYERSARVAGKSKFPLTRMIRLALDGVFSQSELPLRIASYFGLIISFITLVLSIFYILLKVFKNEAPSGFTTIVVIVLFGTSLTALFLGIIGEYLARIYNQVKRTPMTIIEHSVEGNAYPEIDREESHFIFKPTDPLELNKSTAD